ncbi:FAD-dependent oxidoreductase [Pantoea sp. S62]|nr:FAD-dependent oxidoreductase [Pantoea sp. S62]
MAVSDLRMHCGIPVRFSLGLLPAAGHQGMHAAECICRPSVLLLFIQHLSPVSVDNMQSVVLFRISIQRSMSAFRHLCRVQSGKLAGDSMAGHHDSDDNVSARIFQGDKVSTDMLFCSARIRPGRPARPQRFLFPGRMYAPSALSETPCYECRTAAMNGFLFCTAGRTG